MSAFDHALGLLEHDAGYLHVTLRRFVEGRGDDLGIHRAGHVRNFLRALVDEQHHQVGLGVIGSDGVRNVLHQNGLTCLGLRHDERALPFADGRKEVYDAGREVCRCTVAAERELLVGEEWRKMLERYTVAHFRGLPAVDHVHRCEREVLFALVRRTDVTRYHVSRLEPVFLDDVRCDVHIVGRRKVVVVARAQEAVAVGHHFEHAIGRDEVGEVETFRAL